MPSRFSCDHVANSTDSLLASSFEGNWRNDCCFLEAVGNEENRIEREKQVKERETGRKENRRRRKRLRIRVKAGKGCSHFVTKFGRTVKIILWVSYSRWRDLVLFEDKMVEKDQKKDLEKEGCHIMRRKWRLNEKWRRDEGPKCYV